MLPFVAGWTLAVLVSPSLEPELAYEPTSLVEIADFPSSWVGHDVRFTLQVDGLVQEWEPYMTSFTPGEFVALSGWADEEFTWDKRTFDAPYRHVFVVRDTFFEDELASLERFERIEVDARVTEVFGGQAWIELRGFRRLDEYVGEGTLVCVGRALAALQEARFEIAADQLARAKQGPLPIHAIERLTLMESELEREKVRYLERRTAADPLR